MSVQDFLDRMRKIQSYLIELLEKKDILEENYQELSNFLFKQQINNDFSDFNLFIHMLAHISFNFHRGPDFLDKIERILRYFKREIKSYYTNYYLFKIFKNNKKIILFLVEEQILKIDEQIVSSVAHRNNDFCQFFAPEFKPFLNTISDDLPENFNEKRRIGENNNYICFLIREDNIREFIFRVNKKNIPLNSRIKQSIFETNPFLLKQNNISLMKYAFFFGSIKIIKYLMNNRVYLTPDLWLYAIHGRCAKLIYLLIENDVKPPKESYYECFIESIKCHHNEFAYYFRNNYPLEEDYSPETCCTILKNYNFEFIQDEIINESNFLYFCKYGYCSLVDFLLKNNDIDVNRKEYFRKYCYESTALFEAIKNGNIEIVKLLLANDKLDLNSLITIEINYYGEKQKTALILAIEQENIEIIKLLLSNDKLDINILSYDEDMSTIKKETALIRAIEKENIEIIKLLLSNDKLDINTLSYDEDRPTIKKETALIRAIEKENIEIIKLLLSNDKLDINALSYIEYSSNIKSETALIRAIEKENIEIIQLLLSNDKLDINIPYQENNFVINNIQRIEVPTLLIAVKKGNIEIIQLLLSNDKLDIYIPHKAFKYFSTRKLCNYFYNYELRSEETTFNYAVKNSDIQIIKLLLDSDKINPNILDKTYEHVYVMNNINQRNEEEFEEEVKSTFFIACERNDIDIIKLLLSYQKVDINLKNEYIISTQNENEIGEIKEENTITCISPLYFVVESKKTEIAQIILDRSDVDVNAYFSHIIDSEFVKEKTPLHIAVENNDIVITNFLLKRKDIDINIKDERGIKPIYYATNAEIKQLLNSVKHQSIFGGFSTSAVIDTEGSIVIIKKSAFKSPKSDIEKLRLPFDRATKAACCEECVIALGLNGRVFECSLKEEKKKFVKVKELSDIKIYDISGTKNHFLAVALDGRVFVRKSSIGEVNEFKLIESLTKHHIVEAFAGLDCSLFITHEKEIIGYGSDFDEKFMLECECIKSDTTNEEEDIDSKTINSSEDTAHEKATDKNEIAELLKKLEEKEKEIESLKAENESLKAKIKK